jgi:hypothetical protein
VVTTSLVCHCLRALACFYWKAPSVALSGGLRGPRRTCLREIVNGQPNLTTLLIAICYIALNQSFLKGDLHGIQDWRVWHRISRGKWMLAQMPPIHAVPLLRHYWRHFQIDWREGAKVIATAP